MLSVGRSIDLDMSVESYLLQNRISYEPADGTDVKLCCLFHDDSNPSMCIDIETGLFYCFSCHARGNIVHLVQRIGKFATYHDALDWLTATYGINRDESDQPFHLRFAERIDVGTVPTVDESVAQQYLQFEHPYMTRERGIPFETLRQFHIGYDPQSNSVTIPWRTRRGNLLTVKHRSLDSKRFWYQPKCPVLRQHLWGLHAAIGADVVYVCEAEIDALTLWAAGKAAVAIGGSHFSVEQARELQLAGVQAVVPVCDRDKAGAEANRLIAERVGTDIDVFTAVWPREDVKDCNELGVDGCRQLTYQTSKIFF